MLPSLIIPRVRNLEISWDFSWPTDLPDFARFNLILGWDGGKVKTG
jgi:hypothetical protein